MGGDYTRFTFRPEKNYSAVLKQQGRVSLDADWNELFEIEDRRLRSETMDIIGRCVVPATTPDAFRVLPIGSGTFTIGIGRAYVDGIQAECHGLAPLEYDPVLGEERGTLPVAYSDQPFLPAPLPPSLTASALPELTGRTDLIYLDVWQREVTVIEDPTIKEIALGGPDTTTRVQTAWQVKVLTDVRDVSCQDEIDRWESEIRPSAGRLTISTYMPPPDDNPCTIEAAGGYRGIENRLYRVEIHTPGGLGVARFKWSRNNASIVAAVKAISASGDQITVESIGRDDVLRFNVGDWVEVTDDHLEYQGKAGHMARVTAIDEANRIITIGIRIPAFLGLDPGHSTRHTRLRRWDQSTGVDAQGLLSVPALSTDLVDIEDGIQVSFSLDAAVTCGEFKTGDYWVFSARTADGSVEEPVNAPPRGIKHHYCRLGLVTWGATVESTIVRDCRTLWPPQSCCQITVRPGEDIQAAIDSVPDEGGCVCLLAGLHQIYRPLIIDGKKHLTLTGVGAASKLVFAPTAAEDAAQALLYLVGQSYDIEITRMFVHADVLEHLIFIDEACEKISIDSCLLVNGFTPTPKTREAGAIAACILLGDCCDVTASECEIVGLRGIVQADRKTLESARNALTALRPSDESGEGAGTEPEKAEPTAVSTLKALHIEKNLIYFAKTGIELQDVLSGGTEKNRLCAITGAKVSTFSRVANQSPSALDRIEVTLPLEGFYEILEDNLRELSLCPRPELAEEDQGEEGQAEEEILIPADTTGTFACLMEDFVIRGNAITSATGIALDYSRAVTIDSNSITANECGISLNYAFDNEIEKNRIRIAVPDDLAGEKAEMTGMNRLWKRYEPGRHGIGFRFVRGIRINDNDLDAHTAVGIKSVGKECKEIQAESLLRILRIERPWRVIVELVWFLYQLLRLLSAGTSAGTADVTGEASKEEFEDRMFGWLVELLGSSLFPAFVGKAEISDNRMSVTRFGIFLYRIFSVSGIRILRNRISGFQKTGILVHSWYSVGLADTFARFIRCLITLFITFLTMLRDMLHSFLKGEPPSENPAGGVNGGAMGMLAMGVSWIHVLCSRYCSGAQPAEGEKGEEQPPSPVKALVDILDDFLDNANVSWLDDLVNQTYDIDHNSLAGSGDGIWTGMDGSRITNNKVIIWPSSTVPYETMVLGILLKQHIEKNDKFCTTEIEFFANCAMEVDRDMALLGFDRAANWVGQFVNDQPNSGSNFRQFLSNLLSAWTKYIDQSSPLAGPVAAMQQGLNEKALDSDKLQMIWEQILLLIATDLWGYGIVMRGANMVCSDNVVESKAGCQTPMQTRRQTSVVAGVSATTHGVTDLPWGRQALFPSSGIGGIWQFSNAAGLLIDLLEIIRPRDDSKDYLYRLIIWVIFFWVLSTEKERSQLVGGNKVMKPLVHGIRMITDVGLEEMDIRDNMVRDASRHGIVFTPGLLNLFAQGVHARIHRNTVIRNSEMAGIAELKGVVDEFASLIRIENGDGENGGTTLVANNHGTDDTLSGTNSSAVYVETNIAGITDNHIHTGAVHAFEVDAAGGLFTDNITNPHCNGFWGEDA